MGEGFIAAVRSVSYDEEPLQASPRRRTRDVRCAGPIRLCVVSGVRLVREKLCSTISRRKDVLLAGSADFSEPQLVAVLDLQPDVSVIDLSNEEGLVAAQVLRSRNPSAKLVAFAVKEIKEYVFACAAAGFTGYVTREARVTELVQAAHDAVNGRLSCTPQMAATMFDQLAQVLSWSKADALASELTRREQQVLLLLKQGRSNKEIARELSVSPSTVKNHIHSILTKLKVDGRARAAAKMRRLWSL